MYSISPVAVPPTARVPLVPVIGFFGNYELGPLAGNNHLLTYTGVLALITE